VMPEPVSGSGARAAACSRNRRAAATGSAPSAGSADRSPRPDERRSNVNTARSRAPRNPGREATPASVWTRRLARSSDSMPRGGWKRGMCSEPTEAPPGGRPPYRKRRRSVRTVIAKCQTSCDTSCDTSERRREDPTLIRL